VKVTSRERGKLEPAGKEVEAPLEDEPSKAAALTAPIDEGSDPFESEIQCKLPPYMSPNISRVFVSVTESLTESLVAFSTTMEDTVGTTVRGVLLGAPVG
jgi:hypothetical protein